MKKTSASLWASLLAVLVSSACVLTIPVPGQAPAAPNQTPNQSVAEQPSATLSPTLPPTVTDTPLPTSTATTTLTLFPTITPIPTETLTPSITPTPPVIATLGLDIPPETLTLIASTPLSFGDPIGADYACKVIAKRVADETVFPPKYQFTAWWDVINVGQKNWATGVVVLSLVDGIKLSDNRTEPLAADVKRGETVRLKLEMKTPSEPGVYNMTWGLKNLRSNRHFCFFTVNIIVKK